MCDDSCEAGFTNLLMYVPLHTDDKINGVYCGSHGGYSEEYFWYTTQCGNLTTKEKNDAFSRNIDQFIKDYTSAHPERQILLDKIVGL
jgi:hypothetical protein